MEEQKLILRECPHCGKQMEVPAALAEFSCLYCGERVHTAPKSAPTRAEADEAMAAYRAEIAGCMEDYTALAKKFTKKDYPERLEEYTTAHGDAIRSLNTCVLAAPEQREALIAEAAAFFVEAVCARMESDKRWKHKSRRDAVLFETKFILAIYMAPMIDGLQLPVGNELVVAIHAQWMQRFPKSPYEPASRQEILDGFTRKKLCFITTAVCRAEGKPDDCAELTAFRSFRDGYLAACPDGAALIARYYAIAPSIVCCIEHMGAREAQYARLRRDYLAPCYAAIQAGEPERCKTLYTEMVESLQKLYGLQ